MRQAIHIFRKDVRHLWPAIFAVMTLTVVFAYVGAHSIPVVMQYSSTLDQYNTFITLAMPLGWWYLIAATIHEEVLPGHRQFWLTRPYSRKSLLAAKGLFIVAFVNVPKLMADCVILQAQGFHATDYWPNLIGSQILFTAVWLLPYAALAAVTRNLRQFSLAVLVIWVALLALPTFVSSNTRILLFYSGYWFGSGWVLNLLVIAILLTAALAILLCQYWRRRTLVSRMTAAVAVILVLGIPQLLTARSLMAMQIHLSKSGVDALPIRISMDPNRKRPKIIVTGAPQGTVQIEIPLQVADLEQGMDLYSDDLMAEIDGPDGTVSHAAGKLVRAGDGFWQRMYVDLPVFQRLKEEEITLRTSVYLTLLGDQQVTQIEPREKAADVPGLGLCRFSQRFSQRGNDWMLVCFSPFRRSLRFAKTFTSPYSRDLGEPYIEPGSYSPYPAEAGISPLVVSVRGNGSSSGTAASPLTAIIITEAPLAHYRQDFEFRGLRLDDYVIQR